MTPSIYTARNIAIPTHNAHPNPPHDDESLKQCAYTSWGLLAEDKRWHQDFLGLHLRTLCLPKTLMTMGFNAVSKVMNVATMHPLDPIENPELARSMDFSTRAGVAAIVFYRHTSEELTHVQYVQLNWAMLFYRTRVIGRVQQLDTNLTVEDLRYMASSCMLRAKVSSHNRDWPVLIADDVRWCMVAGKDDWPMLMDTYPQTREYLESFAVLCELVSPIDALRRAWYAQAPVEQLVLPDFDSPMAQ